MAVIFIEGPLILLGYRGYPSVPKQAKDWTLRVEVEIDIAMCSDQIFYFIVLFPFYVQSGDTCISGKEECLLHMIDEELVKIISLNVNGVLNPVKRSKILSKLKKEKAQIAFLQETHLSQSEHAKLKRMGFSHVFASSYRSGHRRGVAILISNLLKYEHLMKIAGRMEGTEITLLNVYAPPGSEWLFYKNIFDMMANSQGVVICGGDFNFKLNPILDSSVSSPQNKPLLKKVKTLI